MPMGVKTFEDFCKFMANPNHIEILFLLGEKKIADVALKGQKNKTRQVVIHSSFVLTACRVLLLSLACSANDARRIFSSRPVAHFLFKRKKGHIRIPIQTSVSELIYRCLVQVGLIKDHRQKNQKQILPIVSKIASQFIYDTAHF